MLVFLGTFLVFLVLAFNCYRFYARIARDQVRVDAAVCALERIRIAPKDQNREVAGKVNDILDALFQDLEHVSNVEAIARILQKFGASADLEEMAKRWFEKKELKR